MALVELISYASAAWQAPLLYLGVMCVMGSVVVFYTVRHLPKGAARVIPFLPFFPAYFLLSRSINRAMVRGTFCLTLSWVVPGKLLLYCLDKFLDDNPDWLLSHFGCFLAALPIRIKAKAARAKTARTCDSSVAGRFASRVIGILFPTLLLFVALNLVFMRHSLAVPAIPGFGEGELGLLLLQTAVYMWSIFLVFDLVQRVATALVFAVWELEAYPTFDSPFMATSVTEFWGKRWNLNASAIVRELVYHPVLRRCMRCQGNPPHIHLDKPPLCARLPALCVAFLFSGLLHEIAFMCATQATSTKWEVTLFFIMHGVVACCEVVARRHLPGHVWDFLPDTVRWIIHLLFLCSTSAFLFFPPVKAAFDAAAIEFVGIETMMLHYFL